MTSIPQALEALESWSGSLDELTTTASRLLLDQGSWQGVILRAPTRSVVVNYRYVGLIAAAVRKHYHWRHLVQLVVACVLVQLGRSRESVARQFQSLNPAELIGLLRQSAEPDPAPFSPALPSVDRDHTERVLRLAHDLVPLLAAGLVQHYKAVRDGHLLVHDQASLSSQLYGAMTRLAALYVLHGQPVQADGAHTVAAMCAHPLRAREWSIPVFDAPEFRFHGIRLLDARTRLPTLECMDLARMISSELDLHEQQAFAQLNAICDQFALRGDAIYTALRGFITRHPITTTAQIREFIEANNMQLAMPFLMSCYEPPQPHHLVKGALRACSECQAPMVSSVIEEHISCPTRQCREFERPLRRSAAPALNAHDSLIAKPHILVYWCGPGQDEIFLYDTAVAAPSRLSATLYPGRDRCDISLDGDTIGIDVKSHANPYVLADALNRDLGGLKLFVRKFIAINDQALSRFPEYLDILRRECDRRDVEFIAVRSLAHKLKGWT